MTTKFRLVFLVLTRWVAVAFTGPASRQQVLRIDIGSTSNHVDGGQAVELKIKAVCAIQEAEALEAFVYITQNGDESQLAPLPGSCAAQPSVQRFGIQVTSFDPLFQEAGTNGSGYLLVIDRETKVDRSVSVGEAIRIR